MIRAAFLLVVVTLSSACQKTEYTVDLQDPTPDQLRRYLDFAPAAVSDARLGAVELYGFSCWIVARFESRAEDSPKWLDILEAKQMTRTKAELSKALPFAQWWVPPQVAAGSDFGEGHTIRPRIYRRVVKVDGAEGRATYWVERMSAAPCPR